MRKFKHYLSFVAIVALLFTSCSKDESNPKNPDATATLSFATVLNDLVANKSGLKQSMEDLPNCSEEGVPAFVGVVLTGPQNVGSDENPVIISVNPTPGNYDGEGDAYFTEESAELQLPEGTYQLQSFVVYDGDPDDAGTNVLWVAPKEGSDLASFVSDPLPIDINLGNGVKKYVDVEVICFDNRMVNEYGYLFFDIIPTEALKFCIFGNYCDENGRHFPAEYSVNIWKFVDGVKGEQLYEDYRNNVEMVDGDYAADPLCVALPGNNGEDEFWIEITLEDSDNYGDVENTVIREGAVSVTELKTLFEGDNGNLEYYHFRVGEGCDNDDNVPILPDPTDESTTYKTCLYGLNDSGVIALAYFQLKGNDLKSTVLATGLEGNKVHQQHIHGFDDGTVSTCPDASADTDNDGLISLAEGLPSYGPVILPLVMGDGNYPTSTNTGLVTYEQSFTLGQDGVISASDLSALEDRAVVLHGMTVAGDYIATLPVACGTLHKIGG